MGWQDILDDKEKYAAYLCSREWAEKREAVRKRAGNTCERCLHNPMDACHHLSYERKYNEQSSDLQGICRACHDFTHGKTDADPREAISSIKIGNGPLGSIILCPLCGCEGVGFISNNHSISKSARGFDILRLQLHCEAGHMFTLSLMQEVDDYMCPTMHVWASHFARLGD